ncbi:hypothetical protein ABW20_dc0104514 [Dactylellina cionopaga]|nr:hypothetical protein ABW20_dc0104514 [Dactylellina cionopaga]
MLSLTPNVGFLALVILLLYTRPTLAFGAGNVAGVSKVEGVNWRHGDIEDTLLTILLARAMGGKKFDKLNVSRVYFGNWLRDYSQAIDVGTVKSVSAEAIRLLLCVLGFMTFGFGSKEFEVTAERLGCYRPEDHIDNPKNYADNIDARQYDRRLRGPINERVELAIDPETGMKNYIANERQRIMTSAKHVRNLFTKCIELGRNCRNNQANFHEALRLLGTGLHCLEDFLAHSNYTELALIELGERDVFPHVGRDTMMRLQGARGEVYPLVTGTFGGVDFLHSVTGEVSDKLTQNEIEELEGTLQNTASSDDSALEDLLNKIPEGLLGGGKKDKMHEIKDNANSAQMENMQINPRDPEQLTQQVQQIFAQIMPAIEFHDELMKNISEAIEKIPILPKILEQFEERMSVWVFSIMAPFVVPVIRQVKNELRTGSSEIIESSQKEQHIVFNDDSSTDPTHSMLSKDHFSNVLNEVAGKTASKVVAWVVPQIMQAWDDEGTDINRLMDRIIHGVLHHPAQRNMGDDGADEGRRIMFSSVQEWWGSIGERAQDELRDKISRRGVENGENHKEGVEDHGHGCGKPLGMHKNFAKGGTMEDRIAGMATDAIVGGLTSGISGFVKQQTGVDLPDSSKGGRRYADEVSQAESGGLGGLLSSIGGSFLGGSFSNQQKETETSSRRNEDNSYTESRTEYGSSGTRYGQAEYSRTEYPGGGQTETYRRYDQDESGRGNTGSYETRTETRQTYGGYEQRTERYESKQETYGSRRDDDDSGRQQESYGGGYGRRNDDDSSRQQESYGGGYGRRNEDDSGRQQESYGGGYGRRNDDNEGSYGRRKDDDDEGGYGRRRQDDNEGEYGRRQGESGGYGRRGDDEGEGTYGRRKNDDDEGEYGRRKNDDDEGGYGRRKKDDDEGERQSGWGF